MSTEGNPHALTGALVEFPSFSDTLEDVRTSNDTRVTIDNNAAAISALAGLNEASGSWDQCLQVETDADYLKIVCSCGVDWVRKAFCCVKELGGLTCSLALTFSPFYSWLASQLEVLTLAVYFAVVHSRKVLRKCMLCRALASSRTTRQYAMLLSCEAFSHSRSSI